MSNIGYGMTDMIKITSQNHSTLISSGQGTTCACMLSEK